jgi:hypothetical protein
MTAFNDPSSFAQTDYKCTTCTSVLKFNYDNSDWSSNDVYVSVTSSEWTTLFLSEDATEEEHKYYGATISPFTQFGFGYTNTESSEMYYESLLATNANRPILSMAVRGIALPQQEYLVFSNLLAVLTSGQSSCIQASSGYCILPQKCSEYKSLNLWNYDFKLAFDADGNYIRVPLSTFTADIEYQDENACAIFVENLSADYAYQSVIVGTMFFQNIYAYFNN